MNAGDRVKIVKGRCAGQEGTFIGASREISVPGSDRAHVARSGKSSLMVKCDWLQVIEKGPLSRMMEPVIASGQTFTGGLPPGWSIRMNTMTQVWPI